MKREIKTYEYWCDHKDCSVGGIRIEGERLPHGWARQEEESPGNHGREHVRTVYHCPAHVRHEDVYHGDDIHTAVGEEAAKIIGSRGLSQ